MMYMTAAGSEQKASDSDQRQAVSVDRSCSHTQTSEVKAKVQNHLAQANYYRDAANLDTYRSHAHFLPFINNEAPLFKGLLVFPKTRYSSW